jgi:hypothetical protein
MLPWPTVALGTLYLRQLLGFPFGKEHLAPLQLQWPALPAFCGLLMVLSTAHQPGCWNGKLRSVVTSFGRRKPLTNVQNLTEGHLRSPQHFGLVGYVCMPLMGLCSWAFRSTPPQGLHQALVP